MPHLSRLARHTAGLALVAACTAAMAQGTAYVTSEKDDALTLIDTATMTVKGTIPTCKRGRHIQRTLDGKLMVACTESNAADLIDPATGKSLRRIPLGDDPGAVARPDGCGHVPRRQNADQPAPGTRPPASGCPPGASARIHRRLFRRGRNGGGAACGPTSAAGTAGIRISGTRRPARAQGFCGDCTYHPRRACRIRFQ